MPTAMSPGLPVRIVLTAIPTMTGGASVKGKSKFGWPVNAVKTILAVEKRPGKRAMTELPVLYSFRRCPYAIRARMAIVGADVPVRLREIILRDKPAEMLAASPKGTVPVLVLPDGQVIDESLDVMGWALAQHDPDNWLATRDDALIAQFDGPFKHHLDRYKYATRYAGADAVAHRDAALAILAGLEERLSAPWLAGVQPGFTDIAILPFVRQFRIADPAWFDQDLAQPNVQNWLAAFLQWPGFLAVMQKFPLWLSDGQEHMFPAA